MSFRLASRLQSAPSLLTAGTSSSHSIKLFSTLSASSVALKRDWANAASTTSRKQRMQEEQVKQMKAKQSLEQTRQQKSGGPTSQQQQQQQRQSPELPPASSASGGSKKSMAELIESIDPLKSTFQFMSKLSSLPQKKQRIHEKESVLGGLKVIDKEGMDELYNSPFLGKDDSAEKILSYQNTRLQMPLATRALAYAAINGFEVRCVEQKRVANMLKGGRRVLMQATVIVGNGRGGVGFALAKSDTAGDAALKAVIKACKHVIAIPRFNMHTIYHPLQVKEKRTIIKMWPAPEGHGLVCHPVISAICELAGISDLSSKVIGSSRNYHNVIRGTIRALCSQQTAREIAVAEGKNLLVLKRSAKPLTKHDFL